MFCEESLGKIKFTAFPEWVGPRIMSLESIDYFARCEHFSGGKKKKKNLHQQNFDCKLSLYANESCDERVGLFLAMI